MKKILVPATVAGIAALAMTGCKNNEFKKTKDGLEYKIVKDAPGKDMPKVGDYVSMHLRVHIGDSMLFESRKMNNNQPIEFPLTAPVFKGDMSEGIQMLSAGDSAIFRVSLDSLLKQGNQKLPWMKEGDKVTYDVVLVSFKNQAAIQQEMQKKQEEMQKQSAGQMEIDDKKLQEYFSAKGIKPEKTATGLYYVIKTPGSGELPQAGQTVTVDYTGKTLEGVTFDSNTDPKFNHVQPFSFPLGQRQVIAGWDEGVALMKKGSKATLYIPSPLAYGPQAQSAELPANSILIFDVEVKDIK